ncbi:MAG: flavodoxin [Azovibrio sp.]|nr:flavodoxin [Azovibrio sp.]
MAGIGIYFGTDTGRTRLLAKQMARKLGSRAAAPVNVARAEPGDLLQHDFLILGTPTLGDGMLPGRSTGLSADSWEEFRGRQVALYGLGGQLKYPDNFVDALEDLYQAFSALGATLVGSWPATEYSFAASRAVHEGHFRGLALDQHNQGLQTEARIDAWLAALEPLLPQG